MSRTRLSVSGAQDRIAFLRDALAIACCTRDSPLVVATNFSLSAVSEEHRNLLLVLAVAGDYCTAVELEELERFTTVRGFVPPGRERGFWKRLLRDWAEVGLVLRRDEGHVGTYLLNRALAHDVLVQADPVILGRLHDALASQAWKEGKRLSQSARVALYIGDSARFISIMSLASPEDWQRLFGPDPGEGLFELVPVSLREKYLEHLAESALGMNVAMPAVVWGHEAPGLLPYRLVVRALRGELTLASDLLLGLQPEFDSSGALHAAFSVVSLCSGELRAAHRHGCEALRLAAQVQVKKPIAGALAVWASLCALTGNAEESATAVALLRGGKSPLGSRTRSGELLIEAFVRWLETGSDMPLDAEETLTEDDVPLSFLLRMAFTDWGVLAPAGQRREDATGEEAERMLDRVAAQGFAWVSEQFSAFRRNEPCSLRSLFTPKPTWERRLDRLSGLAARFEVDAKRTSEPREQRLVWVLSEEGDRFAIEARVQRRTRASFTKGRKTVASTLMQARHEPWLDDEDRAVIQVADRAELRNQSAEFTFGMASLMALAGHPRVVWSDFSPAKVIRREPGVQVLRGDDELQVQAQPWRLETGPWAEREGMKLIVYDVDERHVQLCGAIGAPDGALPLSAEPRLAEILGALSKSISMHSDVAPEGAFVTSVPAEPKLVLKLRRDSDQLQIELLSRPLGEAGPEFEAGEGAAVVVANVGGQRLQTRRDLKGEEERQAALFAACPSLWEAESYEGGRYALHGLGACLQLIEELYLYGDEVVCLWSEGDALRFELSADLSGLRIRFGEAQSWLAADIEVEISSGISLRAHDLVSRMVKGTNRYVRLDDGSFVALSEDLAQKISDIATLGALRKEGVSMSPASAMALGAWLSDLQDHAGVHGAELATKRLGAVQEAAAMSFEVPSEFRAQLRSYQHDAFQWLMRLAHWGGGALLCDDMGLGKTVQMLAVLTARRELGPALVVAPVSVSPHWMQLMQEFAPSLRGRELEGSRRQEAIAELGPGDVLVASYGLLSSEAESFAQRRFSTIVLDEAQAIKNARSQRAKAAHALQGDFRVVTTGTPIENHLGELWSIMNFANPGLLGTPREFAEVFGKPIQKHASSHASEKLRKVLRPFLLRRTKSQVLGELPPKTETTLEIRPSEEEASYYAAVRDAMLREIQMGSGRPAQQRMQVLAALMKLRRIACHPRLADDSLELGSAKQDAFLALVAELRDAGHRILVFSQFVGHLRIARENLEARGVHCQYLDGQTSKAQRRASVSAFQAGEGEVFLISLRAGGVGLNLTGADYVIHLDPWWNPAVEDQASDRAHRIGQTRPVTVYRLVTKGTVEEKVLELHKHKRKLAEDLISGSESAGALGVDELLALMSEAQLS